MTSYNDVTQSNKYRFYSKPHMTKLSWISIFLFRILLDILLYARSYCRKLIIQSSAQVPLKLCWRLFEVMIKNGWKNSITQTLLHKQNGVCIILKATWSFPSNGSLSQAGSARRVSFEDVRGLSTTFWGVSLKLATLCFGCVKFCRRIKSRLFFCGLIGTWTSHTVQC